MTPDIKVSVDIPSDDFYLQWDYIFWWSFRFNLMLSLLEANEKC